MHHAAHDITKHNTIQHVPSDNAPRPFDTTPARGACLLYQTAPVRQACLNFRYKKGGWVVTFRTWRGCLPRGMDVFVATILPGNTNLLMGSSKNSADSAADLPITCRNVQTPIGRLAFPGPDLVCQSSFRPALLSAATTIHN